jgi:hypothetical protein
MVETEIKNMVNFDDIHYIKNNLDMNKYKKIVDNNYKKVDSQLIADNIIYKSLLKKKENDLNNVLIMSEKETREQLKIIKDLEKSNSKKDDMIKIVNYEVKLLNQEKEKINKSLIELTEEKNIKEEENNNLLHKNNKLKQELSETEEEKKIVFRTNSKLTTNLNKLVKKNEEINHKLAETEKELISEKEQLKNILSKSDEEKQLLKTQFDTEMNKLKSHYDDILFKSDEEKVRLKKQLSKTEEEKQQINNKLSETENKFKILESEIKLNQTDTMLNHDIFYKTGGADELGNKNININNFNSIINETEKLIKEHKEQMKTNPKLFNKQMHQLMNEMSRNKHLLEDIKIIKIPISERPQEHNNNFNVYTSTDYLVHHLVDKNKMKSTSLNKISENNEEIDEEIEINNNNIISSSNDNDNDNYIDINDLINNNKIKKHDPIIQDIETKETKKQQQNNVFIKHQSGKGRIINGIKKLYNKKNDEFTTITDQNIDMNNKNKLITIYKKKMSRRYRKDKMI